MVTTIAATIVVNGRVIATFPKYTDGVAFAEEWEKKNPSDNIEVWENPLLENQQQISDEMHERGLVERRVVVVTKDNLLSEERSRPLYRDMYGNYYEHWDGDSEWTECENNYQLEPSHNVGKYYDFKVVEEF